MRFVDTNVFVRYFANDMPGRSEACHRLFRRLAHEQEQAVTSEAVIVETIHVLTSRVTYRMSHREIAEALRVVVSLPGLRIPSKARVLQALDLFAQHEFLDFVDALIVTQIEAGHADSVLSYDRDFDRVPGVIRVEP